MKKDLLYKAIEAFFQFLKLPDPIRSHIDFSVAPRHRRGAVGFQHRVAEDHIYNDDKDFFHFHPAILEKYADFLDKNPVVQNFMVQAKPIWDLASQVVGSILKSFEEDFSGAYHRVFGTDPVFILLRFLKYEWPNAGRYLAKPHYDAGSFTLAIAESSSGLRIGSCHQDLRPVDHQPDRALFMISSNYKKVLPTDRFSPGWHDVIQIDEAMMGKPCARWAIVAFIDGHNVEALPRSQTHKWYDGGIA